MQRALQFEGDDVITIFKGMQLEIGAPPQFMDFRFSIDDPYHGGFHLDHCGALLDVEPIGESFVKAMCHDIEDPTFDATAVATNPRARMRPIHRPPRHPVDREPHCAWTVTIDDDSPEVQPIPALAVIERSRAASLELDPIDATQDGIGDYSGDLVSDIDFDSFSHSALVRIADEVCLQMHLLNLSFVHAVEQRATSEPAARRICLNQLIGHAGLTAERLQRALGEGDSPEDAARAARAAPDDEPDVVRRAGAQWFLHPGQAIGGPRGRRLDLPVRTRFTAGTAVRRTRCRPAPRRRRSPAPEDDWTATVIRTDVASPEPEQVSLAKFSGGATFQFAPRRALPLFVL